MFLIELVKKLYIQPWLQTNNIHVVEKVENLALVLLVKDWAIWKECNNPSIRFVDVMIYDFT